MNMTTEEAFKVLVDHGNKTFIGTIGTKSEDLNQSGEYFRAIGFLKGTIEILEILKERKE